MITPETKKVILEAIGTKHISKIATYAKDQGVRKDNSEEYSKSMYSHVLNGRLEHKEIEDLILSCSEYYLKERNARQQRINALEKNLKSSI